MQLRPYQNEALSAILESPSNAQLVVLPTGTGKTVLFAALAEKRAPSGRVLILVHRDELVRQTINKLRDIDLIAGVVKADELDGYRTQFTVASVQTLSRARHMAEYKTYGPARTLIIDEAHHSPARTYRDIIEQCKAPTGLLVGFTATPDRESQASYLRRKKHELGHSFSVGMGAIYDTLTYYRSLTDMIGEGWLCDLVPATIQTDIDLTSVSTSAGDWSAGELGATMTRKHAQTDITTAWELSAIRRPTLCFTPTVEMSRLVESEFTKRGHKVEHIDGTTPFEARQNIYSRLRDGTTQIVTNCMVLTEGFDEPTISCVIVARPTKSRSLFAQMVGRGTRLAPGKTDCLVLSVVDHNLDLSPVTLQSFLDDLGWTDGEKLSDRKTVVAKEKALAATEETELHAEALRFVQAFQKRNGAKLSWKKLGASWRLNLGKKGWVVVTPGLYDRKYDVLLNGANQLEDIDLSAAVVWAEQFAAENGTKTLNDPNAKWRKLIPTPEQITLAEKFKIDTINKTRGELADAITDHTIEPATKAQIGFMRYLGWQGNPDTMTKLEARRWIGKNKTK